MATNSENTPARRIDDNLPAKPLDWEDQPRTDVDEPLGEPLQTIADLFTVEANADAELKNGGMPRMLAFDYFKRGYLAGMSSNAGAARQGGDTFEETGAIPPLTAPALLTDERIKEVIRLANLKGEIIWSGFEKDEDGRYTVPALTPMERKLCRLIEREVRAKAAPVATNKEASQ
jgi:hypothetical protein